MEGLESSRQITEPIDESSETLFRRSRSCFCFPCFYRSQSPPATPTEGVKWWRSQTTRTAEVSAAGKSLWKRGIGAVMKVREWSELAAGPRWKTFIRRFNRNRSGGRHVNLHYDPLSYAMNFDEGPGNGDSAEDGVDGYYSGSRNFSSRYAKGSMDLGKNGPTFD